MKRTVAGWTAETVTVALILACGSQPEASKASASPPPAHPRPQSTSPADTTPDLPPAARVALDSGNALFRAKRYAEALAQYRLTAQRSPGDPTAYMGVYMVADATKNRALADSAIAILHAMGIVASSGPHTTPKNMPTRPPKN